MSHPRQVPNHCGLDTGFTGIPVGALGGIPHGGWDTVLTFLTRDVVTAPGVAGWEQCLSAVTAALPAGAGFTKDDRTDAMAFVSWLATEEEPYRSGRRWPAQTRVHIVCEALPYVAGPVPTDAFMSMHRATLYLNAGITAMEARGLEFENPAQRPTDAVLRMLAALTVPSPSERVSE